MELEWDIGEKPTADILLIDSNQTVVAAWSKRFEVPLGKSISSRIPEEEILFAFGKERTMKARLVLTVSRRGCALFDFFVKRMTDLVEVFLFDVTPFHFSEILEAYGETDVILSPAFSSLAANQKRGRKKRAVDSLFPLIFLDALMQKPNIKNAAERDSREILDYAVSLMESLSLTCIRKPLPLMVSDRDRVRFSYFEVILLLLGCFAARLNPDAIVTLELRDYVGGVLFSVTLDCGRESLLEETELRKAAELSDQLEMSFAVDKPEKGTYHILFSPAVVDVSILGIKNRDGFLSGFDE